MKISGSGNVKNSTRLARIWFALIQGDRGGGWGWWSWTPIFSGDFQRLVRFVWRERRMKMGEVGFKVWRLETENCSVNKHDCSWISRVQQMYIHMLRYDLPVRNFTMFACLLDSLRRSLMQKLLWLDRLHVHTCVEFCFWFWHLRRYLANNFWQRNCGGMVKVAVQ